jgi:hypothetical protein
MQIGFLTEWQLYAEKLESNSWVGEKLDPAKIEKMSGMRLFVAADLKFAWPRAAFRIAKLTGTQTSNWVSCMS